MIRLPVLLLLLVSSVLSIETSTAGRFNRKNNMKPDTAVSANILQSRKHQIPVIEIKENNAGRYFRRRPQTTTVPSIFSMKVESESQHVYPNMSPIENLNIQHKQKEIKMKKSSTPRTLRPNNVYKIIDKTQRRRPSNAQSATPIIQQTEEVTEKVVPNTATAPIVQATHKNQEKVVLSTGKVVNEVSKTEKVVSNKTTAPIVQANKELEKVVSATAKDSNQLSSLESPHSIISHIPKAIFKKMKVAPEPKFISATNTPVVVYSTEKELAKHEVAPSSENVTSLMSFIQKNRSAFTLKTDSPVSQQRKAANEKIIVSTTPAPASYGLDFVPIIRPNSRRPLNRGSYKFHFDNVNQTDVQIDSLDSNSAQGTSTAQKAPPPAPTLSPWYDGYGK